MGQHLYLGISFGDDQLLNELRANPSQRWRAVRLGEQYADQPRNNADLLTQVTLLEEDCSQS